VIRVIVDNPHASWPKFPRVIEEQSQERADRQIKRCVSGLLAAYGPVRAAETTVTEVVGTRDVTGEYVKAAG
jgi:hypothetical protein